LWAAQCGEAFKAEVSLFIPLLVVANSPSTGYFKPDMFALVHDGHGAPLLLLAITGCKGSYPDIPDIQFSRFKRRIKNYPLTFKPEKRGGCT
jgi:hypothetical protein